MANTKDEDIKDISAVQEFKRQLAELLTKFGARISSTCDGDTHGIYNERVIFYVGDQFFTMSSDCDTVSPETLAESIGTEVLTPIPVVPPPVIAVEVFPVGTRVRMRPEYVRTCHSGWHDRYLALRGITVEPGDDAKFSRVLWDGCATPRGYMVHALEKLTPES